MIKTKYRCYVSRECTIILETLVRYAASYAEYLIVARSNERVNSSTDNCIYHYILLVDRLNLRLDRDWKAASHLFGLPKNWIERTVSNVSRFSNSLSRYIAGNAWNAIDTFRERIASLHAVSSAQSFSLSFFPLPRSHPSRSSSFLLASTSRTNCTWQRDTVGE